MFGLRIGFNLREGDECSGELVCVNVLAPYGSNRDTTLTRPPWLLPLVPPTLHERSPDKRVSPRLPGLMFSLLPPLYMRHLLAEVKGEMSFREAERMACISRGRETCRDQNFLGVTSRRGGGEPVGPQILLLRRTPR